MNRPLRIKALFVITAAMLWIAPACAPAVEGAVYRIPDETVLTQKIAPNELGECTVPEQEITITEKTHVEEISYWKIDLPLAEKGDCLEDKPTFIPNMTLELDGELIEARPSTVER